jgi:hypothetical protein
MRKTILVVGAIAALAVAYPTGAGAASTGVLKGTIVSRQSSRHVLVVVSAAGAARTVRTRSAYRAGTVVAYSGHALPDGTFTASAISAIGRRHSAHLTAVVIRNSGNLTFLAAGHSVLVVHRHTHRLASIGDTGPQTGTVANVGCTITPQGTLIANTITPTSQTGSTTIQATVTAITPATTTTGGSLTLSINGQLLFVPLAPGTVLPATVVIGSTVTLTVSFGTSGPTAQPCTCQNNNNNNGDDDNNNGNGDNGGNGNHGGGDGGGGDD